MSPIGKMKASIDHVTLHDMSATTNCFNESGPFQNDVISKSIELQQDSVHKSSTIDKSLLSYGGTGTMEGSRPDSSHLNTGTSKDIIDQYKKSMVFTEELSHQEFSNEIFPSVTKGMGYMGISMDTHGWPSTENSVDLVDLKKR